MSRFSEAISEGDGISVIPVLHGDVAELAAQAEAAGAEAVAVSRTDDVERVRSQTGLPVLVREPELNPGADVRFLAPRDADACILVFETWGAYDGLEDLHLRLVSEGVDCVVDVRNEEELERALERIDPDIILISERDRDVDEEELERTLDLLADVPAGKLVIAEAPLVAREQVIALERAGVDAVLVQDLPDRAGFARAVEELVGGGRPGA